jgi:anti-anti-sigma factor
MANVNIVVTPFPNHLVAQIIGQAGVADVDALELQLRKVAASRSPLVVLDLSQLRFISSLGMGILVAFRKGIVRENHKLRIAGTQQLVADAFAHARLGNVFEFFPTVEAAIA